MLYRIECPRRALPVVRATVAAYGEVELRDPAGLDPAALGAIGDPAAVVLCVDEKSQIQALDRSAPVLPLLPERHTHDYVRNGTTNLYAALDVASGQVIADTTARHRAEEFRRFLNLIERSVPAELDVHVVLDNASTHKTPRSSAG